MDKQTIDDVLRVARELRPDLYERTERVARIIAPEAFAEGWVIHPPDMAKLHALKLKLMQAVAMSKAQAVLEYLGVNTDTDWYAILTRMADERQDGCLPEEE